MRAARGFALGVLTLMLCGAAGAAVAASRMAPAPEQVEELGEVSVVTTSAEGKPTSSWDLLGRLHPALVHFPIGWLMLLLVVDVVGLCLRRVDWQKWGYFALIGTALSLVPTAVTGFLRAAFVTGDPSFGRALVIHRTLNLVVAGVVLIALVLRLWRRNHLEGTARVAYLALVFLATGLVLIAADFGGRMVYGANYLPF
jgi:uncharacterized membrane protein